MYFFYFFPLGLDRRNRRPPLLSYGLMGVMLVAFLWSRYLEHGAAIGPGDLIFFPGHGSPWTVLTSVFLHVGWFHLLGNLLYLYVLSPPLEDRLGPGLFLVVFLLLGVGGNLVHGLSGVMGWLGQPGTGVLGASGAIAGLLAFSLVRMRAARITILWWVFAPLGGQNRVGRSRVPLPLAAGLWFLLQVVQALVATETGTQVSFGAHLGGFLLGLGLALLLGQSQEGRLEGLKMHAREYLKNGQFLAASGAWEEYLQVHTEDLDGWLDMARARRLGGQAHASLKIYRQVFWKLLDAGRVELALDVHAEASLILGARCFGPEALHKIAYYREKQMDYAGALEAYQELFAMNPRHPLGQRALVRVIMLYKGEIWDQSAVRQWLELAYRQLPAGGWRDFLDQEFKLERAEHAAEPEHLPSPPTSPVL